ncbi:MAG: methyltransferase domain-containing protein [Chloroflexi bacterium]|nr:MAG: methyltransferase domain-containing protein [Chloroflexota bacterium]
MKGHKWFAAIYDRMSAPEERRFMGEVRAEVAGGARGKILEIGAGTGLNFPHYRDGAQVMATEPDPFMRRRAERRLAESGKHVELREASAEQLPFDNDSFDTVVGTLVMCSVPHPQRALAEIKRVLKPGGEYRFYEHVRYESAFGAFWQDAVMPVWRWFAAGCHPNRDTVQAIRNAGFDVVELEKSKPLPLFRRWSLPVPT